MTLWSKVVGTVRRAPTWAWGALAGLGAVTAGLVRLRSANARAQLAEGKTARAQLERDTAKADATIDAKIMRVQQLDVERKQLRDEGDDRVAEKLTMDDEETVAWLQRDAAERRAKQGKP